MRILLCLMALASFATLSAQGPLANHVVINEFVYDDSSTDDREFVELYNPTSSPVDLSGWVLEGLDEAWPSDNNADYTIPAGTIIAPGGYYTLGSSNLPVDQAVGATNLWENGGGGGGESLVLRDATGAVVDAVTYESNKHEAASLPYPRQFQEGIGIYGNFASINGSVQSWARWFDGVDTDDNGRDFGILPATLGASNVPATPGLPYFESMNAVPLTTPAPGWTGSFVVPFSEDPTAAGALPNPLGASPDGGNVLVCWDPAGGGNTGQLIMTPTSDFSLECYVHCFVGHTGTDLETWSIGVRGTNATFHNHPVLFSSNGNTGLAWSYVTDASGATLYLIDEGTGGPDNILLSIPVVAGLNDGWQRLRLEVSNCVVSANFGGTLGNPNDGVAYTGVTQTVGQVGQVYLGYRESVAGTTNARPLALDAISITAPLQEAFGLCLSQPDGAGSFAIDNYGLNAGDDIINVFTFNEPCPTGVGTGPYGGLCAANPLTIINQLLTPPNTPPFRFFANGSSSSFVFPAGIPAGLHIEGAAARISPTGVDISPVSVVDTL